MKKPIQRSALRRFVGSLYGTLKKYLYWYTSRTDFATQQADFLPTTIFTHKTILRRKLRDVDMWMQENKIVNLGIAIQKLNGLIIEPGQTCSYWRAIGKPTKRKGYTDGMILHNGAVTSGVGGGLCQLSNLIYWMTLHTPMTVTERWRHGYDVFPDVRRSQPFGSGATCAYPFIDLQIKNNTSQPFQLTLDITDEHLVGAWVSDTDIPHAYTIIEKDHHITHEWFGGYSRNNTIVREIIDKSNGTVVGEEHVTDNHALMMYNPFLEYTNKIEKAQNE